MLDTTLLISAASMGGIGFVLAVVLAVADRKLFVKEDPRVEEINELLPGTNCGGCGYPGCKLLAEKLLAGEAPPTACVAGGSDLANALAGALGVEVGEQSRMVAVVLCRGGDAEASRSVTYRGEKTCTAADLTGGDKDCAYGCLGYGECVDACNFDAMTMDPNGLPVVFYDKCVGCGACARACPRDIIEMHPEEHRLFVYCKNTDKGPQAKKVCKVACIGCTLCTKDCAVEGGITMQDNLAVVNHDLVEEDAEAIKRCPTKCILNDIEKDNTKEKYYASRARSDKEAV